MVKFLGKLFGFGTRHAPERSGVAGGPSSILTPDFEPKTYLGQQSYAPAVNSIFDGEKFAGGFGPTQLIEMDYWTLRKRSRQLFTENLYAKGLIRRLVTNEINTGLTPEAMPDEEILGLEADSLTDWSETIENRFAIWWKNPKLCDFEHKLTFGAIQRLVRFEALIAGDLLVILRQSAATNLPMVQLIDGDRVRTPLGGDDEARAGNKIKHGIEYDSRGRAVAHHVLQDNGESKRIPAFGERSGRRISWMVYGTEKRLDEVRGTPLLGVVLQSLKEIDRYRDSTQRKAVINSIMAMFIEKTADKPGTLPMTGGAVRKDTAEVTDGDGGVRDWRIEQHVPGLIVQELQTGEIPRHVGGEGTDVNFGTFEEAIIQAVAWANEIPPEILRLAFSNNYSASQAAINEFKIYLNKVWSDFGETFCTPIYIEWLISETLQERISAQGLLDAWRNPLQYDIFGAWTCVEWYGSIKPSTDMLKQVKASDLLVAGGYSSRAREARIMTGTKFSKNVKRLRRENEQLVEAMAPIAELEQQESEAEANAREELEAVIEDILEDKGLEDVG